MSLSSFLNDLLEKGHIVVSNKIIKFEKEDLHESTALLKNYYNEDKLGMPYNAPEFLPSAVLWSAAYLYYSVQLAMLRNLDDDTVITLLQDYSEKISPETIYSVDLCFRYLPRLLDFIKGLAPDDMLVKCLEKTVVNWPFSSVGIRLEEDFNIEIILKHNSLSAAYIDRIIKCKDIKRINSKEVIILIEEALGGYADKLWPEFLYLKK
jgi:hypothetical protein